MLRALYSGLMWLVQPLLRAKLARRAQAEPGYAEAVQERFGHYGPALAAPASGWLWVHAVSLGETRAAAVLLGALRRQRPGLRLLLTHGTATGRAEGRHLLQPGDVQVWQPWDTPWAARRFFAHFRPALGLLMETEVWPNLVAEAQRAGVPLVLVNARLSDKSARQARRLAPLSRPAFAALAAVLAQAEADAARLRALGAPVQGVLGNLKFDAAPDAALQARGQAWRRPGRPVVMLASAREGEEAALLAALKHFRPPALVDSGDDAIKNGAFGLRWLIVPRHPQRFDAVAALVREAGFTLSRRSAWGEAGPPDGAEVWLGDSLGEMALYYGLAEVALLGGSFEPLGGQNLIEALACGCPVVMGPHTFNFAEAAAQAEAAGAALRVDGMAQGLAAASGLACDPAAQAQAVGRGEALLALHRGAAERTAALIAARWDAGR